MLDENIIDIIEALKESKNPKVQYERNLKLATLILKMVSCDKNDLMEYNIGENILNSYYRGATPLLKSTKEYLEKSLEILDDEYKTDSIIDKLNTLQEENEKLAIKLEEKHNQHQQILKTKDEIDILKPQIESLTQEIELYASLNLEEMKEKKTTLEKDINTKYTEHKELMESIKNLQDESDKLTLDNDKDVEILINLIDNLKNNVNINLEKKSEKLSLSTNELQNVIGKFENLQKQIEYTKENLKIYKKHFDENSHISEHIENNRNSVLLNEAKDRLDKSDKIFQEYIVVSNKIKNDIDKKL